VKSLNKTSLVLNDCRLWLGQDVNLNGQGAWLVASALVFSLPRQYYDGGNPVEGTHPAEQ